MTVCEEFGLMPVTQTNADTIVICIKEVLLHMNLRIQDTCGQFPTMSGTKNGVTAQIKKLNEKCQLMHCYCHLCNLVVWDRIKIFHC